MKMYSMTEEELSKYLNSALSLAANEMVKDGLITNTEQVTNRYLALVVQKNGLAKMFDYLFKGEESDDAASITVVRIDRTVKAEETK